MEQLQSAWVSAIAAAAGCIVWSTQVIDDGLDVLLEHKHPTHTASPERSVYLGVQLKATTSRPSGGCLRTQVSRKRYREYAVKDPTRNVIVAILTMPTRQENWVFASERSLSLFGACYWVNLAGSAVPGGCDDDRLTISAPTSNVLDDVSLAQIMERVGVGGRP
jgi:hypothetical protein